MENSNYWANFHRISRRRFMATAGTVGAGLAAAALVGCGGSSSSSSGSSSSTPRKGGMLTYSGGGYTETLDPHISQRDAFNVWGVIGDLMVYADPHTVEPIQPGLVESWEQVDGGDIVLKVRQGVKFHAKGPAAGRTLTAEDIAYNIQRINGNFDPQRVALFARRSNFLGMDKVQAVDSWTVRVTFAQPNSSFVNGLADWRNWVVPPELVEADPEFKHPENFTGTGPFMIDGWDSNTRTARFRANPDYWQKGLPYLDGFQEVNLPDPAAAMSAFVSGQIDQVSAQGEENRRTLAQRKPDAQIYHWEHVGWEWFRFHTGRYVFKDARVRKAIFLALNYGELLNASYGDGFWDYTGPLVSGFSNVWTSDEVRRKSGWNPASKELDIAEAKRMMAAAGYPDGALSFNVLPFYSQTNPWYKNAIRLKDQLERVWPAMKITIDRVPDSAAFARRLASGDFDLASYASYPTTDVMLEAALHYRTNGGRNYAKFSDPEVDRLIDSALAQFDAKERAKIMDQLQTKLLDVMYIIPIGKERPAIALQAKVKGFKDRSGPGTFGYYDHRLMAKYLWIG